MTIDSSFFHCIHYSRTHNIKCDFEVREGRIFSKDRWEVFRGYCKNFNINRLAWDFLPTQIDSTPEMEIRIKKLLGINDGNIDYKIDYHIKYLC